jgi:hypothetical protein
MYTNRADASAQKYVLTAAAKKATQTQQQVAAQVSLRTVL